MRKIELTKGAFAIVDDRDFDDLNSFSWHLQSGGYAARSEKKNGKKVMVLMHRQILGSNRKDFYVDHKNKNRLDNRRANLRWVTPSENAINSISALNTSGIIGVGWHKAGKKWRAYIMRQGKEYHLGLFRTKNLAHQARRYAEKKLGRS